jgi:UDP-N-acetylmuramate--alanine ligase
MKNLNDIKKVYFIGIGGIGMSALARFFLEKNAQVFGYDKTETPLTNKLKLEGAQLFFKDDEQSIIEDVDLVIYTPAIPKDNKVWNFYNSTSIEVVKRSDVLQKISEDMKAICVGGTHGKTTMSSMIAHIFKHSGVGCNAFLGGITSNYETNFWSSNNQVAVIEADEYDRSFLKLKPFISVVSAVDADHLDIYGTAQEMENAYKQFMESTEDTLIHKHGLKTCFEAKVKNKISYSIQNDHADFYAKDIKIKNGAYQYMVCKNDEELQLVKLNMGGMHNIENAMAAFAVCHTMKIESEKIALALENFKGVKRRFEYIVKNDKIVYIDDYAHHPEELSALIKSAKSLFAGKKVSVVFQPHLFSRTQDLADGFAESLDMADEVILLPIYPARELPIEGVTSNLILEKMGLNNKTVFQNKESVLEWIEKSNLEVLITAGAGDIDTLVNKIKKCIEEKI